MKTAVTVLAAAVLALFLFTGVARTQDDLTNDNAPAVQMIVLEHARAAEIREILYNLQKSVGAMSANIVADPRTNSLIVHADPKTWLRLIDIIQKLDAPARDMKSVEGSAAAPNHAAALKRYEEMLTHSKTVEAANYFFSRIGATKAKQSD